MEDDYWSDSDFNPVLQ